MDEDKKDMFFEEDPENGAREEKDPVEEGEDDLFADEPEQGNTEETLMEEADAPKKRWKFKFSGIKKNYMWIIVGLLVLSFVLIKTVGKISQIFMGEKKEVKEMVEFLETMPVKVYKVKKMDFKDTLPAMGRIEGFKEIDLMFDGKGILESFNFEEGERILEGDIIASLDNKDAILKLKYAGLEMEKAQKLYEIGAVEKMVLDQKKLEYESAKNDLEKTSIYAPTDGYLASKEKHTGAFIGPTDKIGTFVDYSEVYAAFDIIEEDSPKIDLGQTAEVFLDAYPGVSYKGTIDMISPVIEGRTRTQKAKIELQNEENKMKPGMFARAIINTYEKKDALIIPSSSFKKKENKYFVYIVHPDEDAEGEAKEDESKMGTVEEREITIEYLTHDAAEISKGLSEGELVIREIHQDYKDKDKVEITEVQETMF
ncbi:MAG: efflux RND transporter periplasmic adaptor subunit [Candidatus Omnitrophica bacterium]|nr:efflux RND transporter periplasmic adaptor subunit [Candidatus Omnitrophota bacterium]MDD5488247.1 efflux RND transporter periplasmic adaptor subunit [Candidatus Omnitrophota bacterium]